MSTPSVDFRQLGSSGLYVTGGQVISDEFQNELAGRRGQAIYKQMSDADAIIGGILFAIDMLIRQVDWSVNPASDDPQDQEIADFIDSALYDMSSSWPDTLSEILSFLPYGWALLETVFKLRGGDVNDPTQRSRHDDGRVGWRKLAIRPQDTLYGWEFDDDGGVQAMLQQAAPTYQIVRIPIDKALLFRTTVRKGSPEGKSILRAAFRSWYNRRNIENIEGIGIERDLAGLPIIDVPAEFLMDTASAAEKALVQAMVNLVTKIRRDEQEGVVMPSKYDKDGNKLFDIRLLSTGGTRTFDTDKIISRYDQRIAMTVLADFIMLGHENVGSFALADSKTGLFAVAISAWLDHICGVFNAHAIPRLLRLNGIDVARAPELGHGDIQERDLAALGAYVQSLSAAGMPLFPNPAIERYLLEIAGIPVPVERIDAEPLPAALDGARVPAQQQQDVPGQQDGTPQPTAPVDTSQPQPTPTIPRSAAETYAALLTSHRIDVSAPPEHRMNEEVIAP